MGTLLYKEKRYKGAIEYYLKAMFIECCIPHYDGTGKYTIQVFSEKKAILKYKLCCFYQYCLNSIKELKLSDNELKDIYMNIFMGEIKAPITQKEGWKIIYEKYKKTKT